MEIVDYNEQAPLFPVSKISLMVSMIISRNLLEKQ